MHYFDDYNGFSDSLDDVPLGLNYVYAAIRQLISSISAITDIVPAVYTFSALICYRINGIWT